MFPDKDKLEIVDECIPNLLDLKFPGVKSEQEVQRSFFYMLWRIKESGMDDALIHIDDGLKDWWDYLWAQYDLELEQYNLVNKLSGLVADNFTPEEIRRLSSMQEFKMKVNK